MNNPFDPLTPVKGESGIFTTAVRKSTLPKAPAPAAIPPPPEGFVLDQSAPPPAQSAIPPPPPGFVMDAVSTPPPAMTAPSLPTNIPPPDPVQVAPQSAAAATSAAFASRPADNWTDAIKDGFKTLSFLPFGDAPQLADAAFLLNAARKVERGEATYEDEEMLNDYLQKAQREKTPGYEIVQGIMKLPAFAGELGLTAGAYTAGKTVTMKALKKALGKYAETIAARAGGAAAGVAAQTAASSAPRIAAGTIQNVTPTFGLNFEEGDENIKITPDQDPLAKALARSFAEQALQVGSERVGNLLDKTPPGKVFQAALRRYLKINPGKRVEDFMDVVRNKGLRNSFVAETIEEEIIKPVEVLTGVGTQLRGDENTMENRLKEQYSWKQFLIQSATLAVPGAGGVMINKLFTAKPPKDPANPTAEEIKDRIKAIGIPEEMLGDLPDRMAAAKTPEERDKVVADFAEKFKDVIPETPQDAAQGAQLEFLAGEIGKVRATAGDSAASYFEEKYLNRVKSGQVLTSEQQTIAGQEMLQAIEDSKAGKSFQAPLQEPAMSEVGRPPAEPVAAQPAPANEPISPPPAPTTQDKAGTLAPVAAGASETPISPTEAGAGAPLTSPAAQPKNITPLGAGQPPITISGAEPGTSLGTETKVHGTKGQDYNARYAVMPRSKLVASHDGTTFSKNPEYPLENARDYSNPAEKAKVIAVRNGFVPDRHVTDSTDASVGPVMVAGVTDEKGVRRVVVLGGNNREMAIQTMTPEKRQQLADFTNQRSERFGLPKLPDAEHELVRFMGEYDLRQQGTREKLQEIIDALNPSPGKVQSQSEMAAVDAGNISIDRLNDVSMDVSPKAAAAKIMDLIADKTLDANLRSQISEHPDQAKEYLRRVLVNAAFRDRNIADFISVSDTKSATARGLIEAATQSIVDLRAKGQNELADAFSRSMATVVEYVQSGDDLRTALFRAAKQMEMDPKMAIVQEVAETMRRNVALSPQKKIIAEDSVENFKNVWNQISEGLKKWDSNPDMFGTTTTADDVIRNIMTKIRQEQQFNNGEIRRSTRQPKSAGPYRTIKAKQGQYLIDEMMSAWANKPMGGAIVVQSEADLDALNLSDESRNEIRNSKAEGFYHIPTETVVIIADNLQRPSDAIRVMLHESIGHFGIRKVLGEEFENDLERLGKLIPADELARAKELYGDKLAVEEYLANEASTRNPTLWQEFLKAIRAALKRIGVNDHIIDKWDKRNEIERLIDTAREFVEKGEAKPASEAMSGEIRMSVPQEDTREFKLEQLTPDQMRSEETLRKQNEEARRRKEKLDELAAKPLRGTAGDMNLNLFPGEGDLFTRRSDIRMSKPAEGEKTDTDQHKFSERVSLDPRMTPDLRKAMADRLYETRHNKELIATVMARIDKGLDAAEADFYKPESDLKPDERVAIGQVLMQAHNEVARTATAAKDEATTKKHLNEAISVGRQLDDLGLQYGRGTQAFAIWNETLSTAEGAQRMFARTKDKAIDEVLNRSGKDIETIKKVAVEGNAEAINETLIEERVQERINTILDRLGSNARNGLPDRMKAKAGKQAAQDYFSRPENSETNDPDLRFSKAGEELDKKLFAAAKYGARVMWQAGNTSFSEFKAAMIKKSGPNIEKYLPRIYNEASILLNNVVSRKPVSKKGKDTRKDRAVGAEINAILKDWFAGDPNAEREPVIDLLKAAGMSERSAVDLVMGIQHRFIEKAQKAKDRRIRELTSGRIIPLTNPKAIRQLLELSNLTPLTDDVIRAGIAKAYGLPELTPEVAGRLDEMAKAIRDAAEGFQKDDATRSMLNYIRKQMPKSISDVGWSMWYANILSGYQTAERNFSGNAFNALDNLAASMIAEPRNAPFALWGFIRGVNVGAQSAADVLQTGNFPARGNKYEASSVLELNPFTGIFKVFNAWKYVMRSLYAADMLFFKPAQESRAMMIAADLARKEGLSGREVWRRAAEIMGRSVVQAKAFRRQAMDEGLTGLNVKKRVQEIAEQQRPEELISEPMDYAQRVTFNYQPEGQVGILAKKISDASKDIPILRLAVPFTRIVANVANTTIDHTPWGFVRAMRGMRDVHGNLEAITGHRRAQLVAKATMGTAAMAAVYILDRMSDGDDDDDKKFAIYAAGPGTTSKRRQLEETGWKPYSVRIGKRYFDYRLTPLAVPFAIIGHVRDAERWRKLDEKSVWSRMSYAVVKSGATIFDMSFLSGVNQLVNFIQRDTADSAGNALQSYLSRNASTAIPALLKQIDKTFDDQVRDNATIQEGFLREVPFASHQVKPKLNLLGEPIQQTAGPGSIFFSKERSDPVWKLIVEKEAWISQPAKDTKLGDGIMDQDEYYDYVKESGQIIRRQIEERLPALQEASKERAGKIIDDITRRARDIAKNKIARERLNK